MFFRSLSASMAALLVAVFTFLPFLAQAPQTPQSQSPDLTMTVAQAADHRFNGLDAGDISLEKFETFDRSLSDLGALTAEADLAGEPVTQSAGDMTPADENDDSQVQETEQKSSPDETKTSQEMTESTPESTTESTTAPAAPEPPAPPVTEKPAPQPAAPGSDIKLLGWFDTVDSLFARGDTAIVTDLATGLRVEVARTGGTNHADCETTTSEQTAILLKIAEGSWNWTRRPVIVEVDGERIAASLTARPHAGRDDKPAHERVSGRSGGYGTGTNWDSIKGNNMDGHFDIHFYGSKTHVHNSKDRQHQAAIQVAYHSED